MQPVPAHRTYPLLGEELIAARPTALDTLLEALPTGDAAQRIGLLDIAGACAHGRAHRLFRSLTAQQAGEQTGDRTITSADGTHEFNGFVTTADSSSPV